MLHLWMLLLLKFEIDYTYLFSRRFYPKGHSKRALIDDATCSCVLSAADCNVPPSLWMPSGGIDGWGGYRLGIPSWLWIQLQRQLSVSRHTEKSISGKTSCWSLFKTLSLPEPTRSSFTRVLWPQNCSQVRHTHTLLHILANSASDSICFSHTFADTLTQIPWQTNIVESLHQREHSIEEIHLECQSTKTSLTKSLCLGCWIQLLTEIVTANNFYQPVPNEAGV